MKIISWNVNGIRAALKNGFYNYLKSEKPDIICLQEVKISNLHREKYEFNFEGYAEHWNSAVRPGYSGTAIFVSQKSKEVKKAKQLVVKNGMGIEEFDREGRVMTMEFENFYLVNAYFPNSGHELKRLNFKTNFNKAMLDFLKKLESKKPVILCGDLNVAHKEIDLARPKDNTKNAGFTPEEREGMDKFIEAGFIDTFRYFNPNKIQYSWWSYRFGARDRNIGWRIDYFLASPKIINKIKNAFIFDNITGSDHCPVGIEIVD